MHLHLDAIGGVAGDMFVACVTDAYPELRQGMLEALRKVGLPDEIHCGFESHNDSVLTGSRFIVDVPQPLIGAVASHHTQFAQIRQRIETADIDPEIRSRAVDIFRRLAEVEAGIHGTTVDEVGFHELGGWDSIADMVGAAYLIKHLGVTSCTVSKLPMGAGRVKTSHGPLPVPVPAVAALLSGYEFIDDGLMGERITPTGAAILRHLQARQDIARNGRLAKVGYGFGTKRFPGLSNVLRMVSIDQVTGGTLDEIGRISFDVDDQSLEDLAVGLDRIRELPGVLDVLQSVAYGKKGRLVVQVQVLTQPAALESACEACLRETSTLGVRYEMLRRRILQRASTLVNAQGKRVRVKLAQRPQGVTAKAECDDVSAHAGGYDERETLRRAANGQALAAEATKAIKQGGT